MSTLTAQALDLAAVAVRTYQRTVQTPQGPRAETVAAHTEHRDPATLRQLAGTAGAAHGISAQAHLQNAADAWDRADYAGADAAMQAAAGHLASDPAALAELGAHRDALAAEANAAAKQGTDRSHIRGWIPEDKWKAGQQEWEARGEAARKAKEAAENGGSAEAAPHGWQQHDEGTWHGQHAAEGTQVATKADRYLKSIAGKVSLRRLDNYDVLGYKREVLNPAFRYTSEQRDAIGAYTEKAFTQINNAARSGEPSAAADAISSAMQPMPEDLVLVREVRGMDALSGFKPGDVIADRGFSSTALVPARFGGGKSDTTIMYVVTPKGTPAVWADPASQFPEDEVILDRGQPMMILSSQPRRGRSDVTEVRVLALPKDVLLANLHLASVLLAAASRKDGSSMTGLAERMNDFEPQKVGHADITGMPPLDFAGTITGQWLDLAGHQQEADAPVPDDKTAIAMFTAHQTDDVLHRLAHASERMQAARSAPSPELRRYHSARLAEHLQGAQRAAHALRDNLLVHYPAEARELRAVGDAVGLAEAVSADAKAATTAHLTETTLHEIAHADRHGAQMLRDTPDAEWDFNADHAAKHLQGAVEHAGKIREHLLDNYPAEGRWLKELEETAGGDGDAGKQHAAYAKGIRGEHDGAGGAGMANEDTITAQALSLAGPETVSGQARQ